MKIVIVDDDIFVSGALTTILEASGKVTVAASGTDGKKLQNCTKSISRMYFLWIFE